MNGYYDFSVHRISTQSRPHPRSNKRYCFSVYKKFFNEENKSFLKQKIEEYCQLHPDEQDFEEGWILWRVDEINKPVFSIICNQTSGYRMYHLLMQKIHTYNESHVSNIWSHPNRHRTLDNLIMNAQEFLDHETFLFHLQQMLRELPKRTFSEEDKKLVIESYMSNL